MVTLEWLCTCLTWSLTRVVLISRVTITFDANNDDLITLIGGAKSEKDFLVLGNGRVRLVQTNYYE